MKKIILIVGAVFALFLSTLTVNAATLTNINGDVKVNRGNGYQTIKRPINLRVGDKVLVGQNSSANIVYANGASLPLSSGITSVTSAVGSAGGVAAGAGLGTLGTTALVVGGAVAVGVGIAVVVANNKSDSPASP